MGLKMQDFRCKDCGHEFEVLLDTRQGEQEVICPATEPPIDKDGHQKLIGWLKPCQSKNVEVILGVGTGNKSHVSWSQWRV